MRDSLLLICTRKDYTLLEGIKRELKRDCRATCRRVDIHATARNIKILNVVLCSPTQTCTAYIVSIVKVWWRHRLYVHFIFCSVAALSRLNNYGIQRGIPPPIATWCADPDISQHRSVSHMLQKNYHLSIKC